MGEILKLAEALWKGDTDTRANHPFRPPHGIEQVAEGTWFYKGLANTIVRETGDGLVIIDPSGYFDTGVKFEAISAVVQPRLNTAVYTHGHYDHAWGVPNYVEVAKTNGWAQPRVIAQEALPARFLRYRESNAWTGIINRRQFMGGSVGFEMPVDFYFPDQTYAERLTVSVGGLTFLLRHGKGETDDHTWVFCPDNRLLCTGDLFIWAIPNAGNPQKVQRYVKEWAQALREMIALEPEILCPGHGVPIIGADRARQALENTAALLESIHTQTLTLMNEGATLDTIIHSVKVPENLRDLPYLQPIYDEPEFLARNVWRFYGGWYDGVPSHLKPAPEKAQAEEIARLAGGAGRLIARAQEIAETGDLRLACHLADWARLAAPDEKEVLTGVARIYGERARREPSTMAMGIFVAAARDTGLELEDELFEGSIIEAQEKRAREERGG